mmetsp:Transcript_8887/g.20380  ORF Transcript_8887/g.20380 Transcript_8887/m.20380 type:complete len:740 (+) Transcript_8887:10-2229(+)
MLNKVCALVLVGLLGGCLGREAKDNMNGLRYTIANALPGHEERDFLGNEFFEVYSPAITSRYSEVVWRTLPPVDLPEAIACRFNNSVIAVTGTEVNVVRRNGTTETSVPCYESYNHHYVAFIYGSGVELTGASLHRAPAHGVMSGHSLQVEFQRTEPEGSDTKEVVPGVQAFSEHNGNEARQSYHGLPRNMVQPIASPQRFVFGPMQINTKNPDGSGKRGGPLPKESQAPPGALYSGLLECPCTTRTKKVPAGFEPRITGNCDVTARAASPPECFAAAAAMQVTVLANTTESNTSEPAGCFLRSQSASEVEAVFNTAHSTVECSAPGATQTHGQFNSLVGVTLDIDAVADSVNITLQGPSDVWFAVGFNASAMSDLPWTIVVEAKAGASAVHERKLGDHEPGTLLTPELSVLQNDVQGSLRTVVVTRKLKGGDANRFDFPASGAGTQVSLINALGGSGVFDGNKHKDAAGFALTLVGVGARGGATCLCRGGTGTIDGLPFDPRCMGEPYSDLLQTHNPTCDINQYRGGIACCHDGAILLDADQEVPAEEDTVYFKWRFYFTEYNPAVHTPLIHLEWQWGHIEYDVPAAPAGTPPADAVHVLTTRFQLRDMMNLYGKPHCDPFTDYYCADVDRVNAGGVSLIMAGGHCHAPACISLELYNADTGFLVCRVVPVGGQGDSAFDEAGYLYLPPCQWGSAEEGLQAPPVLFLDTNLTSIKRVNSTVGHTGVMAIWQARGKYNI